MKKYLAEFVGTFSILFFGTGAIIISEETSIAISHLGVSVVFGMIVMLMIYLFGKISGAHFNPAVTIAFSSIRLFPSKQILPYLIAQFAGACAASILLGFLFPTNEMLGATVVNGSVFKSFFLEIFIAFILMLTVLKITEGLHLSNLRVSIIIGTVILLAALFAGPISGASLNPARSFSPAIVSGHCELLWLYLTAPICGTVAAALVWKSVLVKHFSTTKKAAL